MITLFQWHGEYGRKINFVDGDNGFVGYGMDHDCCSEQFWAIKRYDNKTVAIGDGIDVVVVNGDGSTLKLSGKCLGLVPYTLYGFAGEFNGSQKVAGDSFGDNNGILNLTKSDLELLGKTCYCDDGYVDDCPSVAFSMIPDAYGIKPETLFLVLYNFHNGCYSNEYVFAKKEIGCGVIAKDGIL